MVMKTQVKYLLWEEHNLLQDSNFLGMVDNT